MKIAIIGGGLAGLSAAAALGGAGYQVEVFEARPFLGGRATSYHAGGETIDNCQHVLLRCCVNLLDFYKRLGVEGNIVFHREFHFVEPGGRHSVLRRSAWSLLRLPFLTIGEKLAVARGLVAIAKEHSSRTDLESISMRQWLDEKRQPERAVQRFWRQVLVSAISEELESMSALYGFQVFRLGLLAKPDSYEMGVPSLPLADLYAEEAWRRLGTVEVHLRTPVERLVIERGAVQSITFGGRQVRADSYILAVPFERVATLASELELHLAGFEYSPITGIHLWFDRPITDLPQATLLDRTIQWVFNKSGGRYLQLVVSASRTLVEMPRAEVIALALRELAEFFPIAREARLEKAHVVKEIRATLSPKPGLEARRPEARTRISNLFLAGDWTRSGWPAIMEGAVRSGYLAAEAVTASAGAPRTFLLPDIA